MFSNLIVMPCNMQMPFFTLTSWMNVKNNHMVLQFRNEILEVSNKCIQFFPKNSIEFEFKR